MAVIVKMTVSSDQDRWVNHIGSTLKAHRSGRFTVEELSKLSNVSVGLISQIERGIGNPSFATLLRLADALDIAMADLFISQDSSAHRMLVRRDERLRMEFSADGVMQEMLVPDTFRKIGAIQMTIPPGFRGEEAPHSHAGEEVVLLVSGSLEATVGGQEFTMHEGDSLSYDSTKSHWWSNICEEPAVLLAISTPPSLGSVH